MKKILQLSFIVALAIFLPIYISPSQVHAVDIFSQCSNDPAITDKTQCADCTTGSATKSVTCQDVQAQKTNPKNINADNPIIKLLKAAMEVVSFIAGAAAVILIVISGIRYITSNGDPAGVKSSRDSLVYALVGLVIIVLAQAIIGFVLNKVA